ncbi:hypothetical protein KIN20_028369 [Parelaphostrongylus tenuis]|uniref:Amidinotransferase n=1 Tax=Parelaphostrongylus tenuis TaxID=148309 RepID=A0AAD5R0U4_PARTN|nr:hypothetical protein KIN20_028369 [Parelaphostrongylus tenuis]
MVPPKHFSVEYTINPWMGGVVDKEKAHEQWNSLKKAIEKEGVQVLTMEPSPGLPDQVFVCNAGLVYNNKVYLSKFRHKERTGEQEHYLKCSSKEEAMPSFRTYEHFGPAMDPRSAKGVYEKIKGLGEFDTILCELIHPKFYHLDTCFTPVDDSTALWYPPAFSDKTKEEIMRRLPNSIAVCDEEANAFVCNAITVRSTVISPIGVKPATRRALKERNISVVEVDMSEFMKSGGACQCLVLRLLSLI